MSTGAIVTMVVGMVLIWGGLILSVANVRRARRGGRNDPQESPERG